MWVRMGGFIYRGCLTESGLPSAWFQLSVNGRACVHKMKDAECKQKKGKLFVSHIHRCCVLVQQLDHQDLSSEMFPLPVKCFP